MVSKNLQSNDSEQQDNQHHGQRFAFKNGHNTKRHKNTGKNINLIFQLQTKKNITKWVFQKYPKIPTSLHTSRAFQKPHRKIYFSNGIHPMLT